MQTLFSAEQLESPAMRASEKVLRTCVHCGFCTATCPTYVLLGDELDSPRGRIYLMKQMLESGQPPTADTVKHVDRCLSCLSCMTTCPSGVHYMHLVDHGRAYIQEHYRRPLADRLVRRLLELTLPYPWRFRLALLGAGLARPFAALLPDRLRTMLAMAPARLQHPSPVDQPQTFPAQGPRRARMALLTGCAQQVLAPQINEATVRLLTRLGVEVVVPKGMGCCGALTHHMGKEHSAHAFAKANIDAWTRELEGQGLDAVVINASGCGTTIKDYGFMFRDDPAYAAKAARIAALAKDVTEVLGELGAKVAITARKADELTAAAAHLKALGIEALPIVCDMGQLATIGPMVEKVVSTLGPIDVLVNNAGTSWGAPTIDHSLDGWNKVITLNVTAIFVATQEVGRRCMVPRRSSRAARISGVTGDSARSEASTAISSSTLRAPWVSISSRS